MQNRLWNQAPGKKLELPVANSLIDVFGATYFHLVIVSHPVMASVVCKLIHARMLTINCSGKSNYTSRPLINTEIVCTVRHRNAVKQYCAADCTFSASATTTQNEQNRRRYKAKQLLFCVRASNQTIDNLQLSRDKTARIFGTVQLFKHVPDITHYSYQSGIALLYNLPTSLHFYYIDVRKTLKAIVKIQTVHILRNRTEPERIVEPGEM